MLCYKKLERCNRNGKVAVLVPATKTDKTGFSQKVERCPHSVEVWLRLISCRVCCVHWLIEILL